jgi:hypothetical protein
MKQRDFFKIPLVGFRRNQTREDFKEPLRVLLIIEVLINLSEPSGSSSHGGAGTFFEGNL